MKMSDLNSYEISLKDIGEGRFSTVCIANLKGSNEKIAMKKLKVFELKNPEERAKYLKDIQILKDLNHPNLIRYINYFTEGYDIFIALEFGGNNNLLSFISNQRRSKRLIAEVLIWKIWKQVVSAVRYLHLNGIIHKDIKPSNIFITNKDTVKLGDLGLNSYFKEGIQDIRNNAFFGLTCYYPSPEIVSKGGMDNYGFKSDIWTLGCLLYEITMLRPPFFVENMDINSLFRLVKICNYPPIFQMYSKQLKALVDGIIQPNPDSRPDIKYLYSKCSKICPFTNAKGSRSRII